MLTRRFGESTPLYWLVLLGLVGLFFAGPVRADIESLDGDLSVEKINCATAGSCAATELAAVVPGDASGFTYQVTVNNDGIHPVFGASVADTLPGIFSPSGAWTCVASPSTASGEIAYVDHHTGTTGVRDVLVSPDGAYVYVAEFTNDRITVWSRDALSGSLTFSSTLAQTDLGALEDGLNGPDALAFNSDASYLFVASSVGDTVAVFSRNSGSGVLSYSDHKKEGDLEGATPITGLDGARGVALSSNDAFLFVTSSISDAVATLSFSGGTLTWASSVVDGATQGANTVDGLTNPAGIALSSDDAFAYVVADGDDSVSVFSVSGVDGALTWAQTLKDTSHGGGTVSQIDGAFDVLLGPGDTHVYVAARLDDAVTWFDRAAGTGLLTYSGDIEDSDGGVDGLNGSRGLAIDDTGEYIFVASDTDDALAVLARAAGGGLSFVQQVVDGTTQGSVTVDGLNGARAVAFYAGSGSGSDLADHLVAVGNADGAVATLIRNTASSCSGGLGSSDLSTTADIAAGGSVVYQITGTVVGTARGTIINTATASTPTGYSNAAGTPNAGCVGDVDNNSCTDSDSLTPMVDLEVLSYTSTPTSVTPGTRLSYVLTVRNNGPSTSLGFLLPAPVSNDLLSPIFTASAGTILPFHSWVDLSLSPAAQVTLSIEGVVSPGLDYRSLTALDHTVTVGALSPESDPTPGNNSGAESDTLAPVGDVSILKDDGLTNIQPQQVAPYSIQVSNSGPSDLYGVRIQDDFDDTLISAVAYTCSPSGPLSAVAEATDGISGANGLASATAVALAPEGDFLYITGQADHAVAVFSRDSGGGVSFVEARVDGVGTLPDQPNALQGATGVALSPHGGYVYVTSNLDDGLTVFSRNAVDGTLTLVEEETDESSGVDGLEGATGVAVTPDGQYVYVAASDEDEISRFSRNSGTGAVTYLGVTSTGSLDGVVGLAIHPSGRFLYASAATDSAINVYSVDSSNGDLTLVETEVDGGSTNRLGGVTGLAVSPDGANLFASGTTDNAVVSFNISGSTGALTFASERFDGDGGLGGTPAMVGPRGLVVIPDGTQVIVASPSAGSGTLTLFSRFGDELTLVVSQGSTGVVSTAFSPGGEDLYTTDPSGNSLLGFSDTLGASCPAAGNGDIDVLIDLPAGSTVNFGANATVDQAASGLLVNTATATVPHGVVTDAATAHPPGTCEVVDLTNNQCTDTDEVGILIDIQVTKEALTDPAIPGESFSWQITVFNAGPAAVSGASLVDDFDDAQLTAVTWTCTGTGDANAVCGTGGGTGDISTTLDLEPGYGVTLIANGTLRPGAGVPCTFDPLLPCMPNTAAVTLPATHLDTNGSDHSVEVQLFPQGDLQIDKTAGAVNEGTGALQYQVTVRNCGPSDVVDANVRDDFPGTFTSPVWTCAVTGGSGPETICPGPGTSNINELVSLGAGDPTDCSGAGEVTFTIDGIVTVLSGVLSNTATVNAPSGFFDPNPNNSAFVNVFLSASADLSIIKDNGTSTVVPGQELNYSIVVSNEGPDDSFLATVEDLFPPELTEVSWTCSSAAPPRGTLTLVDTEIPVTTAREVALSPDGLNLYVVRSPGSVEVYDRDALTGAVTFVESRVDGVEGAGGPSDVADNLVGASAVLVSPDGAHVIVAAETDSAVTVFARSPLTGKLSFLSERLDGGSGAGGTPNLLIGADGLAMDSDGDHLYVSARGDEGASFAGSGVTVFSRNAGTGLLTWKQDIADSAPSDQLLGARSIAISPDDGNLYVAAEEDDALTAFDRDDSTGLLTYREDHDTGVDLLDGAFDVVVSPEPEGKHVYVSGRLDQSIVVYQRAATGALTATSLSRTLGDSGEGGSAQGLDQPTGIAMSSDGVHLYVASTGNDGLGQPSTVGVYQRNLTSGSLKFVEIVSDGGESPFISGAVGLTLDSAGEHLYLASVFDDSITVWKRAPSPPTFAFLKAILDTDAGADGLDGATNVAVVGDLGEHVYVTSAAESALSAWERNRDTGDLTLVEVERDNVGADGLEFPVDLVATPTGSNLYVASQGSAALDNGLAVFDRNGTSGELSFVEVKRDGDSEGDGDTVDGLFGIAGLAVSVDGQFVYVASRFAGFGGGVSVFRIVGVNGELDWIATYTSGIGGIEGLQGAHDVAVSSDDAHVYVASSVADAVVVFSRNALTGELTYQQVVQSDVASNPVTGATLVQGLDRPLGLSLSPGGENLYVASAVSDSLLILGRDDDDTSDDYGDLSSLQVAMDGELLSGTLVEGLNGARGVAVADDGKFVYATGEEDGALAVFAREATTGKLSFLEARINNDDGVTGLAQPYGVAVTRDTRHVYVTGFQSDSVAIFSRSSGSRCTGSGIGDIVDTVDIAAGGSVIYSVTATVDAAASGSLANTATVTAGSSGNVSDPADPHPAGICVGSPNNNQCTDTDTLTPEADLELQKSNGVDSVIPGEETTYKVEVFNQGPSNVVGASVFDDLCRESGGVCTLFEGIAQWTCLAEPSGALEFREALTNGSASVVGLDGAAATAVDPSGSNLYVTGLLDDAVTVFDIQGDGSLVFRESLTPAGLDGASGVVVSPDGSHVYVTARTQDALVAFDRAGDGSLTFLELFQDDSVAAPVAGATVIDGLDSAVGLSFEPLGDHLYVTASNDNAVSIFSRDSGTGLLTSLGLVRDGVGGVDGLAGVRAVVATATHLYAAGESEDAVARFNRDGGTGLLSFQGVSRNGEGGMTGLVEPRSLALADDGLNLYAAAAGSNALVVFSRDVSSGNLTYRQSIVNGVDGEGLLGVTGVAVSGDGFHVYSAATGEGAVSVFSRELNSFGDLTFVQRLRDGVDAEGIGGASTVTLTPNDRNVYVAGRSDDAVGVFDRPADSSCHSGVCDPGGSGHDCALNDTVDVAAGTGLLYTITGTVAADACAPPYPCTQDLVNEASITLPGGVTETDPSDNTDTDTDSLSPRVDLSITKEDQFVEVEGLAGAADVAIASGGEHLYAVGAVDDALVVFARDDISGHLNIIELHRDGVGLDGLNGAQAVAVSPDGQHVYAAGSADNALVVFNRDIVSGELSFSQQVQNGLSGVTGLLAPTDLMVTDDGTHLIVTSEGASSVSVFARDQDSGAATYGQLTQIEVHEDGLAGVDGLAGARALAIRGDHLYVAGALDGAIALFTLNTGGTPVLTFSQSWFNGSVGISSLVEPGALAFAPNGVHLYVTAEGADALILFERDGSSGELTFLEARSQGDTGAGGSPDALLSPMAVVVAPDPPGPDSGGQHVYVASADSAAVAVFERDESTGALSWVGAIRNGDPLGLGVVASLNGASALAFADDAHFLYSSASLDEAVTVLARDWDSGSETGTGELAVVEDEHNGGGGVAPGASVTYLIRVTNNGPSAVVGAQVTDIFPVELVDITYTCSILTPGASCFAGSGDIVQSISLPAGGMVEYEATATVRPDVSGSVVNTATVAAPDGVIELDTGNDSATDTDTVLTARANLVVDKFNCSFPLPGDISTCVADEETTSIPGTEVAYKVTVDNLGPSDAPGTLVYDIFPEAIEGIEWVCSATPIPGLLSSPTFSPSLFTEGDTVALASCSGPITALDGLEGAESVAGSLDGRSLYVASAVDNAIAAFRRSASTGALVYTGSIQDGQTAYDASCTPLGTVDGLAGAADVLVNPTETHVYVAGATDDAISIFDRDSLSGDLTFQTFIQDGDPAGGGFVEGLGEVSALAISSDGLHLYAAGRADNALAHFSIEPSGALTFEEALVNGVDSVEGLSAVADVIVAANGLKVYALGSAENALTVFNRDATTGTLTFHHVVREGDLLDGDLVQGMIGPKALEVSDDSRFVYVAGAGSSALTVFEDTISEGLSFLQVLEDGVGATDGLAGVDSLAVAASGEHLYAGSPGEDALAVLHRDADTGLLRFQEAHFDPAAEGLEGVSASVVSVDGDQVYVSAAIGNTLAIYSRQDGSRCSTLGSGRRLVERVDLVAGGQVVFVAQGSIIPSATGDLVNSAVAEVPEFVQDEDPNNNQSTDTNTLTPEVDLVVTKDDGVTTAVPGTVSSYTLSVQNLGPSDLVGATLEDPLVPEFVSANWVCAPDQGLTFVAAELQGGLSTDLEGASSTLISSDGEHLYVASPTNHAITVFERDPITGDLLSLIQVLRDEDLGLENLAGVSGLAFSPDESVVFAAASADDALIAFSRITDSGDPDFGQLAVLDTALESDATVDGLDGAAHVTVSPAGGFVYVMSVDDDALAVFQWTGGTLTFVEREKDGFGDIALGVLDGAWKSEISSDGGFLYAISRESHALSVFAIDAQTGAVTFVEVHRDGDPGIDGLNLVSGLIISPAGDHVYTAALGDDALMLFLRDENTGQLTPQSTYFDGVGAFTALDGANALAMSADGQDLALTALNEDSLTVLRRHFATGELTVIAVVQDDSLVGLEGPLDVAFDSTGAFLNVAAGVSSGVSIWERRAAGFCTPFGTDGLTDIVDVEAGGSLAYTFDALINPAATGSVTNTMTVTVPPPTVNVGDSTDSDTDVLTPEANLSITKDDGQTEAVPGASVVYAITAVNDGPSYDTAARVVDTFPGEIISISWTCSGVNGGLCAGSGVGDMDETVSLPPGATVTFQATALIDPAALGTLDNTATIVPGPGVTDPVLDGGEQDTDIDLLTPLADLGILKTASDEVVGPGQPFQYFLDVNNAGPSVATSLEISDTLPVGVTFVDATGAGWVCTEAAGEVTCTRPLLVSGPAPTVTLDVTAPTANGSLSNTGAIGSITPDPVANNDSTVVVTVDAAPPEVLLVNSDQDTGDGELAPMESMRVELTRLFVTFDEELEDPPGDSTPGDVTNPSSYQLLEAGANQVIDTAGCGAVAGDDRAVGVDSVEWDGAGDIATLVLGPDETDVDGLYALNVCGSLTDVFGNALDGDGDGTGGDDFVRYFRLQVLNLLRNGDFDFDLSDWTQENGVPGSIVLNDTSDSWGWSLSGSMLVSNLVSETLLSMSQCVDTQITDQLDLLWRANLDALTGTDVTLRTTVIQFDAPSCVGTNIGNYSQLTSPDVLDLSWKQFGGRVDPEPGLQSMKVVVEVLAPLAEGFDLGVDSLSLAPRVTLFSDGFESGDTSAWSGVTP